MAVGLYGLSSIMTRKCLGYSWEKLKGGLGFIRMYELYKVG